MDNNLNSNECQTSESSEELSDTTQNNLFRDNNAWLHLKTITTFSSDFSTKEGIRNQYHSQETNHSTNVNSFCGLQSCEQEATAENSCKSETKENSFGLENSDFFHSESQKPQSSQFNEKGEEEHEKDGGEVKPILKSSGFRRRRRSNSFSEGHAITDPFSQPINSSPYRNGIMSDVGANHVSESMKSYAPAPVQSLTRFSPRSLLVESLIDQLCKLMEKDSGKQKKLYHVICEKLHQMQLIDDTYTIEEFQFLRSHYQKALYQLLAVAKSSTQPTVARNILLPLPSPSTNADIKISAEQVLEWSRYQHEYQELEYIAKGGFGHVYKARNKLDGGEYAIKKIFLRYQYVEGFLRSLKEVKMLARLNHPNIVSYKAAWLEPLDEKKHKSQMSSQRTKSDDASLSVISLDSDSRLPSSPACLDSGEDSLDIIFQESSPDIENNSNCDTSSKPNKSQISSVGTCVQRNITFKSSYHPLSSVFEASMSLNLSSSSSSRSSRHSSGNEETDSSGNCDEAVCPIRAKESKRCSPSSTVMQNWATLYVQMQLCEHTLRQWLDVRNKSLPAYPLAPNSPEGILALNLFRKIVRGVDYIHTQGIVHHDIKPSNIFVNSNLKEVQVGDFGLSCCILSRVDRSGVVGEHHGEVGTRMYAAPEQLRGKCSSKSDLFSLGIVFLELLQPFHTDMERSKVIQGLRSGHLAPELTTLWPHAARLISDLLTKSPAARPSANELLQRIETLLKANLESDLHSQLASKDETIQLLKEAVASRDLEIAELRHRLSLLEK